MLPRPTRRSHRGFSLFELLIAAGLSAAFAGVVGSAFISTSSLARDSLSKASMNQDVRRVADAATRYLTGASPLGRCLEPAGATSLVACSSIGESNEVFLAAEPTRARFYSYTTPPDLIAAATTGVLTAPDIIEIKYSGNTLIVTRQAPEASANYINPNPSPQGADLRPLSTVETIQAIDTTPTPLLFRYYDAKGNQLGCGTATVCTEPTAVPAVPAPGEIGGLEDIALVEVMPRVVRASGGPSETEPDIVGVDILVAIRKAGGGA